MEPERSLRRWKWIAMVALLITAGLVAFILAVMVVPIRIFRLTDDRLIGTWQSDADRTIAGIQVSELVDAKREAGLRKLFGKMQVKYTATTYTSDFDGSVETNDYQVLGRDKSSVVIRTVKNKPSPLEGIFELSDFAVIHFDTPDSYWLDVEIIEVREYFKRVQ